jgi:hypothetical protein
MMMSRCGLCGFRSFCTAKLGKIKYLNNRTSRYMQMLLERESANQLSAGPRSPQVLLLTSLPRR